VAGKNETGLQSAGAYCLQRGHVAASASGNDQHLGHGGRQARWPDYSLPSGVLRTGSGAVAARAAVLSLSPATRVFVALSPVDMRLGFNGLYALTQTVLNQPVLSGHLFVFTNKRRNRIRLLFWDGSGLWLCAKRLEKGTFGWPTGEGASLCLRPEELQLLLHGIEGTPRRHWYRT
jgi:transposase